MMLYAPLKLSKLKICQPEEEGLFSIYLMIHMTDLNIFFLKKKKILSQIITLIRANICLISKVFLSKICSNVRIVSCLKICKIFVDQTFSRILPCVNIAFDLLICVLCKYRTNCACLVASGF